MVGGMNKYTLVLIGIIVGAPAGYYGLETMFGNPGRAETTLGLFEKYCIPWMQGEAVKPGTEVIALKHLQDETFWVEPESYSTVTMRKDTCAITDVLQPMSVAERQTLSGIVADFITNRFPKLRPDTNHGLSTHDEVHLWMQHPIGDARRWGISLMRFQATGENASTYLILHWDHGSSSRQQDQDSPNP